ncbi:tRNA lysidine(34) synthetase TilS [Bacillus solimangrovi]|uniref:tRNA(Ile)-lysidine synthase n=1 Tax=Bacillus solimangrovi TaxID=1305675 RepID=A0A1E5LF15_9BACI|nr:tRNA lysidine(34) synthetase TilS [Bacillus solimangrovi]OEH92660.1 tRNA lysidine(34) synthetase TilS [Bacillus solimangrovi]
MEQNVESFISKHQLIDDGDKIVVGLSGGPDSLALLHILWKMSKKRDLTIIAAHLNHNFRGVEAEEDCSFVKHFCKSIGIHIIAESIDVPAYQKKHQLNPQQAARDCRYAFYKSVMESVSANKLALGHHGDDQIETMLMRTVRGNLDAMSGIPVKRPFSLGVIIRPLLNLSKQQIEAYCERENLYPRRDSSNEKEGYTRNRYRKHILPFLKKENPRVHEHMQYMSEVIREESQLLNTLAWEKVLSALIEQTQESCTLDIKLFKMVPVPLQRRGIHLILKYLYNNKVERYSSIHIEEILRLIKSDRPSGYITLPNQLRIVRKYDRCMMTFNIESSAPFNYELYAPGKIESDQFVLEAIISFDNTLDNNYDDYFKISYDFTNTPLIVRTYQPGDRMVVFPNGQTKKVSRIFIDEKVPKLSRKNIPIVTDQTGHILWIPTVKKTYQSNASKSEDEIVLTFRSLTAGFHKTP